MIKLFTLLDLCVSSLRRGHANLLCIVPILTDDPRRESIKSYTMIILICDLTKHIMFMLISPNNTHTNNNIHNDDMAMLISNLLLSIAIIIIISNIDIICCLAFSPKSYCFWFMLTAACFQALLGCGLIVIIVIVTIVMIVMIVIIVIVIVIIVIVIVIAIAIVVVVVVVETEVVVVGIARACCRASPQRARYGSGDGGPPSSEGLPRS